MYFSAEMSHGQMVQDIKMYLFELGKILPVGFYGTAGGIIFTPEELTSEIKNFAEGK